MESCALLFNAERDKVMLIASSLHGGKTEKPTNGRRQIANPNLKVDSNVDAKQCEVRSIACE